MSLPDPLSLTRRSSLCSPTPPTTGSRPTTPPWAATVALLVMTYRMGLGAVLLAASIMLGAARMAAHVHHGQDIVAGLLIAVLAVGIAAATWRWVRPRLPAGPVDVRRSSTGIPVPGQGVGQRPRVPRSRCSPVLGPVGRYSRHGRRAGPRHLRCGPGLAMTLGRGVQWVTVVRKLVTTGSAAVAPYPASSTTTATAMWPRKAANQASVGGFFPLPISAVPVLP